MRTETSSGASLQPGLLLCVGTGTSSSPIAPVRKAGEGGRERKREERERGRKIE
jgi:hypothetical protein